MSFLSEILAVKREEIREAKSRIPEGALLSGSLPARKDFLAGLKQEGLAVIAEVKRASPSKGPLAPGLDLQKLVGQYQEGGAAAVSVLTDKRFFGGGLDDLRRARQATELPLLRKDFIIDPYQVAEASHAGADAILLIVACLEQAQLRELLSAARDLSLGALVETHTRAELERALELNVEAVGINNRDLHTFQVDLDTTLQLLPIVPDGIVVVAESGIKGPKEAETLAKAGVDAILVGEALVKSADPAAAIKELRLLKF